ncbi:MAG: phosphoglycolate phosphatase [Rhodoferax sp.]
MTRVFGQFDVEAVIVDLDGTMVDTVDDFVLALNLMLADLPAPYRSYQVDRATVSQLVGKGSEHLLRSVLSLASAAKTVGDALANDCPPGDVYSKAWPSYQRHYLAVNGQHSSVYPGVRDGLLQLREHGLRLACLTNKPTSFALPLLKAKGLDGFFAFTFGGDAFERKKPDPLPLLKTCHALATPPQRTLMIGDSSNDAQAARAAACPVLLVTYGYNHGEPIRRVDADAFADSLAHLIQS